jgi:hypothetical protein
MKKKILGIFVITLLITTVILPVNGITINNKILEQQILVKGNQNSDWLEQAKLNPTGGANDDQAGRDVSINGEYVIIGAHQDDDNGADSGSAYVFKRDGTSWAQQAKLTASDGAAGDAFGWSNSIYGEYAIVGAPDSDGNGTSSGSVYVFKRSGTSWTQQTKLSLDETTAGDKYGFRVSLYGEYAAVGVPGDDDKGENSGSVNIFNRSGTSWSHQAKLTASDGAAGDRFGVSVSLYGDYLIAGAHQDDDNGADSGSAYVFKRDGTSWAQQAKLTASDGTAGDLFGYLDSVSINGDYALIGAYKDDDNGADSGSAYVFKRSGTSWAQQAKLTASDGAAEDWFGFSVSINDNYAMVGGHQNDDDGTNSGSVYVFSRDGSTWTEDQKLLASDGASYDIFGASLSMEADYVIIGAAGDNSGKGSGYVFKNNNPPNTPSDPNPPDEATDVDLDEDLSWTGGDPDPGDTVTYNVYFGISSPPPKVSDNQSGTTYDPGTMDFSTQYYWNIIAYDNHDASTIGPEWSFTTIVNNPPNEPSNPDPSDGETDVPVDTDLSWTCSDPDGDPLTYDVYFEADDSTPDALVSENQSGTSYNPPGNLDFNTQFYWQIVAWDEHGASNDSLIWSFTTIDNSPPYEPSNPEPWDGETNVDVNHNLYWTGGDPDGDSVTYDVYFGTSTPPPLEASGITLEYYDPGTMDWDTLYYWRIIAEDEHGSTTTGPIWSFTTEDEPANFPPEISNEVPPDDTLDLPIHLSELNVYIDDPEDDSFDWSIETSPDIGSNSSSGEGDGVKTCSISGLQFNTTYTWYVNATDPGGGGLWTRKIYKFSTVENFPPGAPTIIGETEGKVGVEYEYTFNAVDPDGDDVKYFVDWDDGDPEETGFNPSGDDVKLKNTWNSKGTYTITAYAEDTNGLVGPEGTLIVIIKKGKSRAINTPFQWFLEQHPYLFPILRHLLRL